MKMNYFVLGTNELAAASAFYDALFGGHDFQRIAPSDRMIYWMKDDLAFAVATPFDGEPATHGNGTMLGFAVGGPEDVNNMHSLALQLGGTCEGAPGQRGPRYSAYVRDLDGNKLCLSDG